MQCRYGIMFTVMMIALASAGCGQPAGTPERSATVPNQSQQADPAVPDDSTVATSAMTDPAAAVHEFLDGVRLGDDQRVSRMMTKLAREKIGQQNLQVAPRGSDTAKFEVGKVEYVGGSGARVAATWSDLDADQQVHTDSMLWVVRKDPEGWRILGMAAEVFPGEPPLLLNFEEPEQTEEKLKWLKEEVRRRADAAEQAMARQPETSSETSQR